MHILYLNPSSTMGGAEVALLDMMASIKAAQPDWQLSLILCAHGPLEVKANALGVSTLVLILPRSLARLGDAAAGGPAGSQSSQFALLSRVLLASPQIAVYLFSLRKTICRLNRGPRLDAIHTNGFKMHILGALAKPAGVPLIWHIHDYPSSRPFMSRLIRAFQKRCSLMLANSNSVKSDIESVLDSFVKQTVSLRRTVRVQTLYNGIDTSVFSPAGPRLDLDQLSGLQPADGAAVRVGLVGTLARWKGHEVFLRALALIPRDVSVRGYIIGGAAYQTDGSQYSLAELKSVAQQLGLSGQPGVPDRIGFTGFIDQPAAAMRSLDIVVHASTHPEPFGLVIVEAMACGRAVIVSESGGATELIEPGTNALGHTPGDAAELAERILQLASNPELRSRLGAAGRATAERRFNRARLASELIPVYEELATAVS